MRKSKEERGNLRGKLKLKKENECQVVQKGKKSA
jgi:hypothetical protein